MSSSYLLLSSHIITPRTLGILLCNDWSISVPPKNHNTHDTASDSVYLTPPRKEALDHDIMSPIHSALSKSQLQAWSYSDLDTVH